MVCRAIIAVLAAGSGLASAASAYAQVGFELRQTLDASEAQPAAGELATTALTIEPEEDGTKPRRAAGAGESDPFAPEGLRSGGLMLFPSLETGVAYTSNVRQSASDPEPDAGLRLRPILRYESDWSRHALFGQAGGELVFYRDNGELDSNSLDIHQTLRLDVRRSTAVELRAAYGLEETGLGDPEIPSAATGERTDQTIAGFALLRQEFTPLAAELRAGATGRLFGDVALAGGGEEDNGDRDYIEPMLSLRTTYGGDAVLRPYVEAAYVPRLHLETPDRNGLERDSQGLGLSAGVVIDGGPLWEGELGLTYLHRFYEDPALAAVGTAGLTGRLTWSPLDTTRFTLSAGTAIEETESANIGGTRNWTARLAASHDLRNNIEVEAEGGIEIEDTGAGNDITYDVGLALSWRFNPLLAWTAGYDATWLDAANDGRSYVEHRLSTGVTISR